LGQTKLFYMPKRNNHENGDDENFGQENMRITIFEHQVRYRIAFHENISGLG